MPDYDATRIADSEANIAVQLRWMENDGSIRVVFEQLDLGWSLGDAIEFCEIARVKLGLPEGGAFAGYMVAFATVCVEQDRRRHG